jgi:hypothetical protein
MYGDKNITNELVKYSGSKEERLYEFQVLPVNIRIDPLITKATHFVVLQDKSVVFFYSRTVMGGRGESDVDYYEVDRFESIEMFLKRVSNYAKCLMSGVEEIKKMQNDILEKQT